MNAQSFAIREFIVIVFLSYSLGGHAGALSDTPLSLKGSVPPNVMFSLSVEYPTAVQQAYNPTTTPYNPASEFLGLFDANKCYSYDTVNGWFVPQYMATAHSCLAGEWSGNFLNWGTMTGLDEFRHAMTGGNRYVDTSTTTVLERSYIDTHGGTGYFANRSYTGAGASPYPTVTLSNATNGVKMTATGSGTSAVVCNAPSATMPYCGTLAVTVGGTPAGNLTCTTWAGSGTSASPYQCSSLVADLAASGVVATSTPATAATFASAPIADTVSCTNPTYTAGAFNCTYALSGGTTGTCDTQTGTGSSASPFRCTTFDPFGAQIFSYTASGAASSFTNTVSGTTSTRVPSSGTTRVSCTITGATSISCPLADPAGATLTSTTRSNSGTRTFSNWSFSAGVTGGALVSGPSAVTSGGTTAACGNRTCYTQYNIAYTWNKPTTSTQTLYYIPSYTGTRGVTSYYTPSYTLNTGGTVTYNVRVKVCDPAVGLESNCKAYGTSYKPTGVLQDNGDIMKFGVFSYYNSDNIDNAVMRSKAKYIAPQKFVSSGGTIANTAKEWSETDGTLIADPDPAERAASYPVGANPPRSGVIKYINQFGRPVDPLPATTASTLKTYDPVGKLYFETLNYLRGLPPTPHFYAGATAATDDDFPIITSWGADPIEFSCQKNYIILLGDKNTHCDKRLPGGTTVIGSESTTHQCRKGTEADDFGSYNETIPATRGPGVNVSTWTNTLGNLQGDSPNNTRAASRTGAGSNGSWYMSGLAYWAARNDIRSDDAAQPSTVGAQKVKTYIIDVEEGGPSATSQFALAAKYGGAESFDANGNPVNSVYTSSADHSGAAFPSYPWPKTLLRASDPAKMIASVKGALSDISAQIGTESALAQSSGDLRTGAGAYIYRAIFNSGGWIGDVQAFSISASGVISDAPTWEASTKLPAHSSRRILTYNDGLQADGISAEISANARTGVLFAAADAAALAANFSSSQQSSLNKGASGAVDGQAIARINYLRGDASNEGGLGLQWRTRNSRLGDSVNSNPTYVGAPLSGLKGNAYNSFALSYSGRKPMVYVGGNDGMLHGYDASVDADGVATLTAGTELLAYVPSAVYGNLSQLMSVNYSHKYFVDGTPAISEACFSDCNAATAVAPPVWKTVLVGGLNAGGQGIYALNITDPDNFSTTSPANLVLWEFTDRDDPDLGFTFGKPVIRLMNNGKWAVIFGNGFNNTHADGHASSTGRAYLYIVFVTGPSGANKTWTHGTDYFKIELKSPNEAADTPPNGLSAPAALDINLDGDVDYIYAGDRQGNVWKIDVSNADTSHWKSAFGTVADPLPLFTTSDGAATPLRQQITTGIELSAHPNGGYLVLLGTGSYIEVTDPLGPFRTDSYYGLWDKQDGTTRITSRSQLQKQTVLAEVVSGSTTYSIQSACKPNYLPSLSPQQAMTNRLDPFCPSSLAYTTSDQQLGWVFDLPNSGERVVSDKPLLESSLLTFTTLTPSVDPCTGNTVGREYNLDYLTGGQSTRGFIDLNSDRKVDSADKLTVTLSINGVLTAVSAAPSGRRMSGGASDTPVRFVRPPPGEPPGIAGGPVCSDFIPGWGCPSRMGPPSNCSEWVQDVVSNEFLTGAGSGLASAPMKCIAASSGRLSWRQIAK